MPLALGLAKKLDCPSMPVPSPGDDGGLILVGATDAIRLCREDAFVMIPRWGADLYLTGLHNQTVRMLRDFAARARLFVPHLSALDDSKLVARVRSALKRGELALLKPDPGSDEAASDAITIQRRLIRSIHAQTRGRLSFGGRRFRLVPGDDLAALQDRDDYEVVGRDEAVKVMQGISQAAGAGLRDALDKASALLTRDWRPPLSPTGIVLLRRTQTRQAPVGATEAAITPSQLKKALGKTEWIEIVVTDDLGKPYSGPYEIQLPDGSTTTGNFDEQGMWADYDIDPGTCKMVVPDIPERVKAGTMTSFIAIKLVGEDGTPLDGYSYALALADGSKREGKVGEGAIRADAIDPGDCTFTLKKAG